MFQKIFILNALAFFLCPVLHAMPDEENGVYTSGLGRGKEYQVIPMEDLKELNLDRAPPHALRKAFVWCDLQKPLIYGTCLIVTGGLVYFGVTSESDPIVGLGDGKEGEEWLMKAEALEATHNTYQFLTDNTTTLTTKIWDLCTRERV